MRNLQSHSVHLFEGHSLQGFGLLQRNRNLDDYQDLEAHYEKRPGYFVEPVGDWGAGLVQLSELVSDSEIHDNIFAGFRPASPLRAQEKSEWRYRLIATGHGEELHNLARVHRSMTSDIEPQRTGHPAGTRLFLIDFTGADLSFFKNALDEFQLLVGTSSGKVEVGGLDWNPHAHAIRARVHAYLDPGQSAELTVQLRRRDQPVSEIWLTHWAREPASQEQAQIPGVR